MKSRHNKATFAGRSVSVTSSSLDFRRPAAQSLNEYTSASLLGMPLMDLLQRILPRKRQDELLASTWLKRRVQNQEAISRSEIHNILRLIAVHGDSWMAFLGDSFNLADRAVMYEQVIEPLYIWWSQQHQAHQALVSAEAKHQQSMVELTLQIEFWRQQSQCDNQDYVNAELELMHERQDRLTKEHQKLIKALNLSQQELDCKWPNWQNAKLSWQQQGKLSAFLPVPKELESIWQLLEEFRQDPAKASQISQWLQIRQLCLNSDKFIWEPEQT